ncbi:ATP-binding cassette domain-containing protein|nr:ATP-binding cassette domain-containing protein [archaeon]
MAIVKFKDFSWTYQGYKKPTLRNINLSVKEGEFLGVIGRVGSGRSTFCMTMLGLIPHFFPGRIKGELVVDGLSVEESSIAELSTRVGLIFQSPDTQLTGAGTTVEEELAFGLENLGVPQKEMNKRVKKMVKLIGLESFRNRSPFELSGGQQQKVAIASVLIMQPRILVLDEPTAQLDPLGTSQVFDLIKKLAKKGITIILNTQKINYLAEFADRVAILNKNKLVKVDKARKILTDVKLLRRNGIIPSVYTQLSEQLIKEGLYKGSLCLTLGDAKKMIKKVVKK